MLNFFGQLKCLLARFTSEPELIELFLNEAVDFHVVINSYPAGWAIVALFFSSANACLAKQVAALRALFWGVYDAMAD